MGVRVFIHFMSRNVEKTVVSDCGAISLLFH